jgi:hypothetical protein
MMIIGDRLRYQANTGMLINSCFATIATSGMSTTKAIVSHVDW